MRFPSLVALSFLFAGVQIKPEPAQSSLSFGLMKVEKFGGNPGNLAMYVYQPTVLPEKKTALLVALHGCGGSAEQFSSAGFNELAESHHFFVLYPQQKTENNSGLCFNHLIPNVAESGEREFDSIMQMIHYMLSHHKISRQRVFIVGFSAGGQVANILAATYPQIFNAGAIIGAGGYICEPGHSGIKGFVRCPGKRDQKKKRRYLAAGHLAKRWPRLSIWHGKNDGNVPYEKMYLAVEQWQRVHKLKRNAHATQQLDGNIVHDTYKGVSGRIVIESYTLNSAAHTIPITPQCGSPGLYFTEEKICFAREVIRFFGLEPRSTSTALQL